MPGGSRAGRPRPSVWLAGAGTAAPKRKAEGGDGTALDRERIVAATVRLLDAEGLAKFSMRRLAADLGVTAMSVYWYVDTKDDLLELALDEICAELSTPDLADEGADWRDQLRGLATEYRDLLLAHPWASQLLGRYLNIGPRSMTFAESTLAVMARSGVAPEKRAGSLAALFQFIYGFCTIEALHEERSRASGVSMDEYFRQVTELVADRPEFTENYGNAGELLRDGGDDAVSTMRKQTFDIALETVIAGMEALRDRAEPTAAGDA
ncbi:TetR/AcrR family transcriptional regulator C-terminal domain-containing protein [Streptomyces sp. HU2014]|uniref:TetR/AcrR family transcriptional regulator n=1 Tax=Streptomyces TaxID=1883 RepID=UPI000B448B6C|nr:MULTISPECIES: TetR/AcrR family transcriptional regulator C-terminal domain-containing protein [Streptomyces]UQI48820.1 TetR/AcrR family transcriptional regulator C-terminal domain-containing protein [Streptomyces sp. HU2014]